MDAADPPPIAAGAPVLPAGACLVHIGPSKTGTTSLQGAMWAARAELRRQGVHYAGRSRHSGFAARAVVGGGSIYDDERRPPPMRHWNAIIREVAAAHDLRVMLSSEFLARADADAIRRVVESLGHDRVHVAVTLRPVASMLASRWQQAVQAGSTRRLGPWLEDHLGREGGSLEEGEWTPHRYDRLIQAWADVVGMDRITAVVVDERDHGFLLRSFEGLLGVRTGTLELQPDHQNRSLRLEEVEAVRQLNVALRALGQGRRANTVLVRDGAARGLKTRQPGSDEAKVVPPRWATERAGEIARLIVDGIRASGVRVVGDVESLLVVPDFADPPAAQERLPTEAAVAMLLGTIAAAGVLPAGERRSDDAPPILWSDRRILPLLGDRQLLALLVRRRQGQAVKLWRALRGKGGADV